MLANKILVLSLTIAFAAAIPATAASSSWSVRGTTATGSFVSLSWADDNGTAVQDLAVGDHVLFASLAFPVTLDGLTARGNVLTLGDGDSSLHVHDNRAGVTDAVCVPPEPIVPPEPVHPPEPVYPSNPCSMTLASGHFWSVVEGGEGGEHHVLEVMMERGAEGGIIPCVRVVINGPMAFEGGALLFNGDLRLVFQG